MNLSDETIAALRAAASQVPPGRWKLWGMDVLADPKGSSDVKDGVLIARTRFVADAYAARRPR